MVDVFVHRTGLDTAVVEESRDLVQVVSDGGKLPCDCFDLVRVNIEHIRSIHAAFHQHQVLRDVGIVCQQLLGVFGQAVAAARCQVLDNIFHKFLF